VPLETYVSKFVNMKFEPSGMTNDPDVRFASSIVDYVFRRLALDHLPLDVREGLGIKSIDERKLEANEQLGELPATADTMTAGGSGEVLDGAVSPAGSPGGASPGVLAAGPQPLELAEKPSGKALDAPLCYECGSRMQPSGSCYVCSSCGSTSGCS
jgi:ribonucleoside-diphosphate reductase alpha chain